MAADCHGFEPTELGHGVLDLGIGQLSPVENPPMVEGQDDRSSLPTLKGLIVRAEAVSAYKSTKHVQRALILDMAVALVALAKMNAELLAEREQSRIIIP